MGNSLANHNYEIIEETKHIPYNSQFCDFFPGRKIRINGEVESIHRNVGIFAYQIDPENMSQNTLQLISNGIMRLRTLRHPHILHVIESFEIKNGVKGKSFIITEKAVPISHIINSLSTTHIKLGIYQILTALQFLHSFCKLSHNNLTSDAIFVKTNSYNTFDFKLASMEYTTSLEKSAILLSTNKIHEGTNEDNEKKPHTTNSNNLNESNNKIENNENKEHQNTENNKNNETNNNNNINSKENFSTSNENNENIEKKELNEIKENGEGKIEESGEIKIEESGERKLKEEGGEVIGLTNIGEDGGEGELTNIELKSAENRFIHFRDVWALGSLLPSLFKDKIDKNHPFYDLLQDLIEKLKDKKQVETLTVEKVLEHGFFRENIVISVIEFLKYLSAKGREQKEEFFKNLKDSVKLMSPKDLIDIVLPHILCVETLREPSVHFFLSHLFIPKEKERENDDNRVFEKEVFENLIMSWINRSFHEANVVIRIVLLKQISNYLKFIKADELENVIWPLVWNSSNEQNDELVIATINAYVHLLSFWKSQKSETLLQKIQLIIPYVSRVAEVDTSLKVRVAAIRVLPKIWQSCPADINHSGFFIHFFDTFRRNFHSEEAIVRKTTLESVMDSKECFSYHNNVVHILPHCLHLMVDKNKAVRDQCHLTILTISRYIQSQTFQPLREELMPLKPWDLLDPFRRQFNRFVDGHLLLSNEEKSEDISLQNEEYKPKSPPSTPSSLLKEDHDNQSLLETEEEDIEIEGELEIDSSPYLKNPSKDNLKQN